MVRASRRTGVPVFMRLVAKPSARSCSVMPCDAGSATLPPCIFTGPTCMSPLRKVPAVSTTALAVKSTPRAVVTPCTSPLTMSSFTALSCHMYRLGVFSIVWRQFMIKRMRSAWARGLHMAGPFDRLSMRNCRLERSVTMPICPPSASISLTICPLAMPPTAGLQLIWAILFISIVMSKVVEPKLAAAHAASQPAWPAPITITSKS